MVEQHNERYSLGTVSFPLFNCGVNIKRLFFLQSPQRESSQGGEMSVAPGNSSTLAPRN